LTVVIGEALGELEIFLSARIVIGWSNAIA